MAQMLVLSIPGLTDVYALSSRDVFNGSVRTVRTDSKYPRHVLWTYQPLNNGTGILYDHKHYKMLRCVNGELSLGTPGSGGGGIDESFQWERFQQADGNFTFAPRASSGKRLAHPAPDSDVKLVQWSAHDATAE